MPGACTVQAVYRFSINEIQISEVYTGVTAAIANGSLTTSFLAACYLSTTCASTVGSATRVVLPSPTFNNNPLENEAYISVQLNLVVSTADSFLTNPTNPAHFWSVVEAHVTTTTARNRNSFGNIIISDAAANFSFRVLVGASDTTAPQAQLNAFIHNSTLLASALEFWSDTINVSVVLNATVTVHRECQRCTGSGGIPLFASQFTPRECEDGFQGECSTCARCVTPTYRCVAVFCIGINQYGCVTVIKLPSFCG